MPCGIVSLRHYARALVVYPCGSILAGSPNDTSCQLDVQFLDGWPHILNFATNTRVRERLSQKECFGTP